MMLETIIEHPEVTLMMTIDTVDEGQTAIIEDREVLDDQEVLEDRKVQEDQEVLASQDIGTIAHQAVAVVILVEEDLKRDVRIELVEIGSIKKLIVMKQNHTEELLAHRIPSFPPIIKSSMTS